MDLNDLKIFNDTLGHAAGDKALITAAREMEKNFSKCCKLYRTGGDEFMAIFRKGDVTAIEALVKKFQESLSKTQYRVACGFAAYKPGDNIEDIFKLCDKRMYENKQYLKNIE